MALEDRFSTSNIALASYLLLEGIEFKEIIESPKKGILEFSFVDLKLNCRDLERVFLNSDFKRYYDSNKYLLRELHTKQRDLKTQ